MVRSDCARERGESTARDRHRHAPPAADQPGDEAGVGVRHDSNHDARHRQGVDRAECTAEKCGGARQHENPGWLDEHKVPEGIEPVTTRMTTPR